MADQETTFRLKFEDDDMQQVFLNLIAKTDQLENSLQTLQSSQAQVFNEIKQSTKAGTQEIKNQITALDKEKLKTAELKQGFKGLANEVNILGINVGGVIQRAEDLRDSVTKVAKGLKGATAASRGLKAALIAVGSTGVAAIATLAAFLLKTQVGLDKLSVIGEQIKVTLNVVISRLARIGKIISEEGLRKGLRSANKELNGTTREAQEAVKRVGQLQTRILGVRRETTKLAIEEAKRNKEVERLKNLSEDTTKSESVRITAARKAISLQNQLTDDRIKLLEEEKKLKKEIAEENNQTDTNAFLEADAALKIQILELDAERFSRLTEIQNKERELTREAKEAQQELLDILAEANAQLGGPAEIARNEYDLAIRKIEELKEEARRLGLELDFSSLESLANSQLNLALEKAKGAVQALPSTLKPIFNSNERDFVAEGAKIIDSLVLGVSKQAEKLLPEQAEFIKDQLFNVFDSFVSIIDSSSEAQIKAQDRVINKLREQTSAIRTQLGEQERLQEQGFANNVGLLKKRLEEQNKLLAKAQEERLRLERSAANKQLLADSVQQASQLTLGATRLAADGAKGGIVGLLTAIGGIGLLFRVIAQAKANAAKFSEIPKFRTGGQVDGERLSGPSHQQGGIMIEAEGGEWILNKRASQEHSEFLAMVNNGAFSGVDLTEAVHSTGLNNTLGSILSNVDDNSRIIAEAKQKDNIKAMQAAYKEAAMEANKELIEYFKTRPIIKRTDVPQVVEFFKGGIKHKQILKPSK